MPCHKNIAMGIRVSMIKPHAKACILLVPELIPMQSNLFAARQKFLRGNVLRQLEAGHRTVVTLEDCCSHVPSACNCCKHVRMQIQERLRVQIGVRCPGKAEIEE